MKNEKAVLVPLVALLLLAAPGYGEEAKDTRSPEKLRPRMESDAVLQVGRRRVEIHGAAHEADKSKEAQLKYFQKPILAFRVPATPPGDWPAPVYAVETRGDQIYLSFHLISATQRSLQRAKERVLQTPTEIAQLKALDSSLVDVDVWPTTRVYLAIEDRREPGVAIAEGHAILGSSDRWEPEIYVPVARDKAGELKTLLQNSKARFKISLEWEGLAQKSATKEVVAGYKIRTAIQSLLDSDQIKPGDPIFRNDREKIIDEVWSEITSVVSATNDDMVKMFDNVELPSLFFDTQEKDFEDLTKPEREALAKYLEPLVDEIKETQETTKSRKSEGEQELDVDFMVGNANSGPVGLKLSSNHKHRVERQLGVTLKEESTTRKYVPHQVEVSQLRENWQQRTASVVQRVAVATEVRLATEFEDYVTADFNEEVMKDLLSVSESGEIYAEIPLGAMLCFFGAGAAPPPGFAWADGQGNWPQNAGWLRPGLRGAPLPDMRSSLVGGADDDQKVGQVWKDGVLVVPAPTEKVPLEVKLDATVGLKGTVRKLRPNERTGGAEFEWEVPIVQGGRKSLPTEFQTFGAVPLEVKAEHFSWPQKERTIFLNGPATNPPHVQCRWIIRVR